MCMYFREFVNKIISNITAQRIGNTFIFTKKSHKKVYEPDSLPSQQQTLVLLRFKIKGGTVDAIP